MRRIIFTIAITSLLVFTTKAQFVKTDSPVLAFREPWKTVGIIGADGDAFYTHRIEKDGKLSIERYNKKTFAQEWQVDVALKDQALKLKKWDEKVLSYLKGNKIYFFVPVGNKDKKRAEILLCIIGTDGKIISDYTQVGVINDEFVVSSYFNNQGGDFNEVFSPDSSKIIFCMNYYTIGVSGGSKSICTVDLKNPNAISKEVSGAFHGSESALKTMDGTKISQLYNFAIDNDGLLAYSFTNAESVFAINIYNPATKTEQTYKPNFGSAIDFMLEGNSLAFLKKGKLFSCIIVREGEKQKGKKVNNMMLVSQIDIAGKKLDYETNKYFSEEWRAKYDPKIGIYSTYNLKLNLSNDGDYIVSAFKYGGTHSISEFDDAVITKIDAMGTIKWMKTLPVKAQANCFYMNNNMYYIFNDNNKNETIDLNKVEVSDATKTIKNPNASDANVTCITLGMNGVMKRSLLQEHKEPGFFPFYKNTWVDKNKLLLYYRDKGKESFSIVTIP